MKTILLTGAAGFIGRNIAPALKEKHRVLTPNRGQLNLLDENALREYLHCAESNVDIVIHCAFPTGHNPLDRPENMIVDTLRIFKEFKECASLYGKFIYFGSGAEFGKSREIKSVSEEEIGQVIPIDDYGLVRYRINEMVGTCEKMCNLRLFGCYGPYDPPHKFITHVLNCILTGKPITIRQNTYFDYLYVGDLPQILDYFIENTPKHRGYNVCTGKRADLKTIAKIAKCITKSELPIVISNEGLGLEYTASNSRLIEELSQNCQPSQSQLPVSFTSLEEGIAKLYYFLKAH